MLFISEHIHFQRHLRERQRDRERESENMNSPCFQSIKPKFIAIYFFSKSAKSQNDDLFTNSPPWAIRWIIRMQKRTNHPSQTPTFPPSPRSLVPGNYLKTPNGAFRSQSPIFLLRNEINSFLFPQMAIDTIIFFPTQIDPIEIIEKESKEKKALHCIIHWLSIVVSEIFKIK